jgi:hypothetical protein
LDMRSPLSPSLSLGPDAAGTSFGELVLKLWQPQPEEVGPKIAAENQKMPAAKGKRDRKR